MNYKYARTLGNKKRNTFLAGLLVALLAVAGCALVVAGVVDYGIGKLEKVALDTVQKYIQPPAGTGTYTPGPTLYEQLHKEWRQRVVSSIAHDDWDNKVSLFSAFLRLKIFECNIDTRVYLKKWNI